MHRWALSRRIVWACLTGLVLLTSGGIGHAQPSLGREYIALEPRRAPARGDGIEVIEFFNYGCPTCYETQPHIARWRQKADPDINYRRIPAAASAGEAGFALTYYALEATGELERLHWPLYDNHHFDNLQLNEENNLLEWLARNGVDADRFRLSRNSPAVQSMTASARRSFEEYDVKGVPAFVVDGRYLTSARLAGGVRELMGVVTAMIERVRKERAAERPRALVK